MKKILFASTIIALSFFTTQAYAATPTPAPTKTSEAVTEKIDNQINQLKEKIASRVSELNLVEKRGIIGTVTEVKGNQLTLSDAEGNVRFVDVDEITKFSSGNAKDTFGLSDITKGSKISILGIYNKQSKRLLARFINTYTTPTMFSGAITTIDAKNFQITVMTPEQKEIKVDIDTSTKLSSYTAEDGLVRYGFSKLAVGDRIAFVGSTSRDDANIIAASRIVDFIDVPKDPRITITTTTTASAAASPTTGTTRNTAPAR